MADKASQAAPLPSYVPPGWYPDPTGVGAARYWDGSRWSKHHRDAPPPDPVPSQDEAQEREAAKEAQEAAKREQEPVDEKPQAKLGMGLGWIKLYDDRVESSQGGGSLKGAHAHIDSRGWRGQKSTVVIEGPDVAISIKSASNSGIARNRSEKFIAQVNSAAARLGPAAEESGGEPDALAQLERLGNLRNTGVISEEEFTAKKEEMLKRA